MITPERRFDIQTKSRRAISVSVFKQVDYLVSLQAMSDFASHRQSGEQDQIWLLQHPPVYTQGTACQQIPLKPSAIDVIKTDRGGQITYHGPGQIVMYPLLDLKRYGLGVKALVYRLEQAVIDLLAEFAIVGERRLDAPGIYVNAEKIAALGLRIRRGTSYHGLSLNVDMDLSPFANIDPCGYQGLQVTQLADRVNADRVNADRVKTPNAQQLAQQLLCHFVKLI